MLLRVFRSFAGIRRTKKLQIKTGPRIHILIVSVKHYIVENYINKPKVTFLCFKFSWTLPVIYVGLSVIRSRVVREK